MNIDLILAERIARFAHLGQYEESTDRPYIEHVERVVALVGTADEQIVAWLHDVCEDCDAFADDKAAKLQALGFRPVIIDAVLLLTRGWFVSHRESYDAYINSLMYPIDAIDGDPSNHTRGVSERARWLAIVVKIADLRDHLRPDTPPAFWQRHPQHAERYAHAHAKLEAWINNRPTMGDLQRIADGGE
jgi:hypothetical protein